MFFLAVPWAVILIAAGLAMVFAAKRRCCRPVRVAYPAARPPVEVSSGGGIARWSIVGVGILVLGLVVVVRMYNARLEGERVRSVVQYSAAIDEMNAKVNDEAAAAMAQRSRQFDKAAGAAPNLVPGITPAQRIPAITQPPRRSRNWLKPDPPAPSDPTPHWSATIEHVRVLALPNSENEVFKEVCTRLRDELGLQITPPLSFASNRQWVEMPKKVENAVQRDPQIGDYAHVTYQFELTPEGWRELGRLERADRSEFRMEEAARGLGLLTILLGAIAAYIRLDEWTKGYYSGRLFVTAGLLATGLGYLVFIIR